VEGRHYSPLSGNQAAAQLHLEHGMALAVELDTFSVNFFGLDQRIRVLVGLAAPCGCMVSLIARSDSCKRLSMKSGEPGSPGSDLRFAGLCLDVATVEW
jgi:hypothetical protein